MGIQLQGVRYRAQVFAPFVLRRLGYGTAPWGPSFYTRLAGLRVPATVIGVFRDNQVESEDHLDGRCPVESIFFVIPSLESPPTSPLPSMHVSAVFCGNIFRPPWCGVCANISISWRHQRPNRSPSKAPVGQKKPRSWLLPNMTVSTLPILKSHPPYKDLACSCWMSNGLRFWKSSRIIPLLRVAGRSTMLLRFSYPALG